MPATNSRTSYDEVPYESHPFAQTHPDRLCTLATLLGLKPATVARCRVLELGCAAGGNLIPMACALPASNFIGIDLSEREIADGKEVVGDLGLTNIELKHLSILDIGPDFGKFDYIICHGVYSWVPAAVQEKILDICSKNLAPQGIAYVSYNTYPGWHMRGMIRDMMSYHARQFTVPEMKVRQSRNLLDFLVKASRQQNSPYGLMLKQEAESIRRSSDSYLFHEHLEDVNEPVYFYQFVERAAAHGLKYLAETELSTMVPGNYPPEIENVLLAQDMIHMEQYMDFLRNRMFRQSLLCQKHVTPNYSLKAQQLKGFHVASPAKPQDDKPDLASAEPVLFETPAGVTLNSREPLVKAAMTCLAEAWPQALPFTQLVEKARARVQAIKCEDHSADADTQALGQTLLSFYGTASTNLIELYLNPPAFVTAVSDRPRAFALARLQAARGPRVTNLRHESVFLGEFERQLLRLLDGTHDRAALADALGRLAATGELTVEKDGSSVPESQLAETIAAAIDRQLPLLAGNALLIA